MLVTRYATAQDFLAQTQDALLTREATNSLILGISFRLKSHPDQILTEPFLATVTDKQELMLAVCMTPPHHLILYSHRPQNQQLALEELIKYIRIHQIQVPGCIGPVQVTADFSHLWQTETGQTYRIATQERLFELTQVTQPSIAAGKLRQANQDDHDLLLAWLQAFFDEALPESPEDASLTLSQRLNNGDMFVWEVASGQIVSMAAKNRPIINVISIGPVYTPPAERGKGYASNCVAALSQLMLDSGWKTCSLFTNLANPTSNSIYQKIGYHPLEDFNEIVFE
jgi:predicted GNAT family acetyltransferase